MNRAYLLAGSLLLAVPCLGAGQRTWTSVSGATIEATLVRLEGENAVLRRTDGVDVSIPVGQLGPADREVIRQWHEKNNPWPNPPASEREEEARLPVFREGPWSGWHAVVQRDRFRVFVAADGFLVLQPVEDGRPTGPHLVFMDMGFPYWDTGRSGWGGRPIARLSSVPQPAVDPPQVAFEGEAKDGVTFSMEYQFRGDAVTVSARVTNPRGVGRPSWIFLTSRIPATHRFPPATPLEDIQQATAGHQLYFNPFEGSSRHHAYHESLTLSEHVREAWWEGAWGSRRIQISAERRPRSRLILMNYEGQSPYQGFRFLQQTRPPEERAGRITIEVTDRPPF